MKNKNREEFDYELELTKAMEKVQAASVIMDMIFGRHPVDLNSENMRSTLNVCRKLVKNSSRRINKIHDDFLRGVEIQAKIMNSED